MENKEQKIEVANNAMEKRLKSNRTSKCVFCGKEASLKYTEGKVPALLTCTDCLPSQMMFSMVMDKMEKWIISAKNPTQPYKKVTMETPWKEIDYKGLVQYMEIRQRRK